MNIKITSLFIAIILTVTACNSQTNTQVLSPTKFSENLKSADNATVLDVRTPGEFADGFIENAINIDYNGAEFKDEISKLDKDKTYYVYCLSGKRSESAASYMLSNGFKNVINLEGGILAWQASNLPLVTTSSTTKADKISFDEYTKMITSDTMVLVDYFAPWCAPCIKMQPMLEELSKEYAGKVKVIRLDIDQNKNLAKQLEIVSIPVIKIFVKGKETWTHEGYIEKGALVKQL